MQTNLRNGTIWWMCSRGSASTCINTSVSVFLSGAQLFDMCPCLCSENCHRDCWGRCGEVGLADETWKHAAAVLDEEQGKEREKQRKKHENISMTGNFHGQTESKIFRIRFTILWFLFGHAPPMLGQKNCRILFVFACLRTPSNIGGAICTSAWCTLAACFWILLTGVVRKISSFQKCLLPKVLTMRIIVHTWNVIQHACPQD